MSPEIPDDQAPNTNLPDSGTILPTSSYQDTVWADTVNFAAKIARRTRPGDETLLQWVEWMKTEGFLLPDSDIAAQTQALLGEQEQHQIFADEITAIAQERQEKQAWRDYHDSPWAGFLDAAEEGGSPKSVEWARWMKQEGFRLTERQINQNITEFFRMTPEEEEAFHAGTRAFIDQRRREQRHKQ